MSTRLLAWTRREQVLGLFAAALVAGSLCHPDGASLAVHAQLVAAMLAFLLAGSALEWLAGLRAAPVFHRIALGQLGLLAFFYLRSLPCALGLPGLGRAELWLELLACAGLAAWRSSRAETALPVAPRPPAADETTKARWPLLAPAVLFLAWSAGLHWFLGRYSGQLETPSSDPDVHAFLAKLTLAAGHIVRTQAPYSADFVTYPSGFSALNTLWMLLGGASPVSVVNAQPALQGCLAVGLVLEAGQALRGRPALASSLLTLAFAYLILVVPVHPDALALEGTARLAGPAFLILPLTYGLRLRRERAPAPEGPRARGFLLLVAGASVVFSFALNPALLLALPPVLLAALILWPRTVLAPARACAALLLLAALALGSDAWVQEQWRERRAAASNSGAVYDPAPHPSALQPAPGADARDPGPLQRALSFASGDSALWLLPRGCLASPQCRGDLAPLRDWTPLIFLAALLFFALRRRLALPDAASGPARLLLALAAALWFARALHGALSPGDPGATLMRALLERYAQQGLGACGVLLWLLVLDAALALFAVLLEAIARARGRALRAADAWVALGALALFALGQATEPALAEEAFTAAARALGPPAPSGLGPIEPVDLDLLREAAKVVPKGERVLLPGLPAFSGFEAEIYPLGMSRAVPLYSTLDFAFFNGLGAAEFDAPNYRRHVCRVLDLEWLAARRVRWLVLSPLLARDACVHGLERALDRYFALALRVGDRLLFRLRDERLGEAAADVLLGAPLGNPARGEAGRGVGGAASLSGPVAVSGWACDAGSSSPATIELEMKDEQSGRTFSEFHPAALENRAPEAAALAGCPGAHAFAFAPVLAPAGRYRARLFAWDGAGLGRVPLGDGFPLQLDF